jgi:hypothetical protein
MEVAMEEYEPRTARSSSMRRQRSVVLAGIGLPLLVFEWVRAPNATIALGPLWLAWYGQTVGWVLAALLFPFLFACVAKPGWFAAGVSSVALTAWLILGAFGKAIGC